MSLDKNSRQKALASRTLHLIDGIHRTIGRGNASFGHRDRVLTTVSFKVWKNAVSEDSWRREHEAQNNRKAR